jgi:hypothetical protein
VSVAGVVNGLTQALVANKKYGSIKELRGTIVGVQSLASGATTMLKRIFKKNGPRLSGRLQAACCRRRQLQSCGVDVRTTLGSISRSSSRIRGGFKNLGFSKITSPIINLLAV